MTTFLYAKWSNQVIKKKKKGKPNRCVSWKSIECNQRSKCLKIQAAFNLLNVIHFLSNKNNKGYEFKCSFHSFYQPPLFSFSENQYVWWNCFHLRVSRHYKWSPWYTKITSKCGGQYQVQSDGACLRNSAELNFNEAEKNHV